MNRIYKLALVFSFISILTLNVKSQYDTGIGLRGGWTTGLTVKHFITPQGALEGMITNHIDGIGWIFRGYFEFQQRNHNINIEMANLSWFAGAGFHTRFVTSNDIQLGRGGALGASAIVGVEYKIPHFPFTLGLDFSPFYEFFHSTELINFKNSFNVDGALSARYIF